MGWRGIYCIAPNSGWNNQQLTKNCGIVPYLFHKHYGFRAVMVGTRLADKYPALSQYLFGVEMDFLPDAAVETECHYLDQHAADMDVLVLHGFFPFYFPILHHYRSLRPDGKVYLELDPNVSYEDRLEWNEPAFRQFIEECDVIGASCHRMQKHLGQKWPCIIEYLPNGFYNFAGIDMEVDFSQKKNTILTVGRIGTEQKRNEDLLEAFAQIYQVNPDWQVKLIGTVEPAFETWLAQFYVRYPLVERQVILMGPIQDKAELMREYQQAKIFAITSIFEGGTPNVVAEALFSGCCMVTSSIEAADDVTAAGSCGLSYEIGRVDTLAEILQSLCQDEALCNRLGRQAVLYGQKNFDFNRIVARLYYLLFGQAGEEAGSHVK